MKKKITALLMAAAIMLSSAALFTGCGVSEDSAVAVQSVSMITGSGNTAVTDRTAGVVVSSRTLEIYSKSGQKVVEVNVKPGDEVKKGDVLFSYDEESLKLEYEKLQLQKEQYSNLVKSVKERITQLKKNEGKGNAETKLQNSIDLQTAQIELKEAEFTLAGMDDQINDAKELLGNADVKCEVNGRVKSLNEQGMDAEGNAAPFITIVETGAFRVQGSINELNLYSIDIDERVIVRSRFDNTVFWKGCISEIEMDSPSSDDQSGMMYSESSDNSGVSGMSSKYPFYVTLDDADGLILGQHVYIEKDVGQCDMPAGMWLPAYYICDIDTTPAVWIKGMRDRLTKVTVELGEYDADTDSYEIISGLAEDDYIAFADEKCVEGAKTIAVDESSFGSADGEFTDGVSFGDTIDEDIYFAGEEAEYYFPDDVLNELETEVDPADSEEAFG